MLFHVGAFQVIVAALNFIALVCLVVLVLRFRARGGQGQPVGSSHGVGPSEAKRAGALFSVAALVLGLLGTGFSWGLAVAVWGPHTEGASSGFSIWGNEYIVPTLVAPWVFVVMGPVALAAAFAALSLRRFTFVFWTGVALTAVALGALILSGKPDLLVAYLLIFLLIVRGRSAFAD